MFLQESRGPIGVDVNEIRDTFLHSPTVHNGNGAPIAHIAAHHFVNDI
jgi:hypothetical protein